MKHTCLGESSDIFTTFSNFQFYILVIITEVSRKEKVTNNYIWDLSESNMVTKFFGLGLYNTLKK